MQSDIRSEEKDRREGDTKCERPMRKGRGDDTIGESRDHIKFNHYCPDISNVDSFYAI